MVLRSGVQIVAVQGDVVNYTPKDFPTVITDAMLVRFEGNVLIVHNGWEYREVQPDQVVSVISAEQAARDESADIEREDYDGDYRWYKL
jgi:hypothetical protein